MSEQIATGLLERDATEGLTMSGTLSETGSATSDLTKEIGYNRDPCPQIRFRRSPPPIIER